MQSPSNPARVPWETVTVLPAAQRLDGVAAAFEAIGTEHVGVIFSKSGETASLLRLGRRGATLTEIRLLPALYAPVSAAMSQKGEVYVLDAAAAQVVVLADPYSGHVARRFDVKDNAKGLCVFDGQVFVSGLSGGALVHVYDTNGISRAAFGQSFGGDKLTEELISVGPVGCMPDGTFMVASDWTGHLRAYSVDGMLRWDISLTGYLPISVTSDGTEYRTAVREGGFHQTLGIVPLGAGHVIVQIGLNRRARSPHDAWDAAESISTIILRSADGAEVGRLDKTERIRFAQRRGDMAIVENGATQRVVRLIPARVRR